MPAPKPGDDIRSLVARCNQGERQAWEEFYARYFGMVSAAVKRMSRSKPNETEDTVQDVFLHLFKALGKYDPSRSLEAYILEIARRVGITRYRHASAAKRGGTNPHHRQVDAHDSADRGQCVSVADDGQDQEALYIRAEETHLLRLALNLIGESCRELLGLRYDHGLSYKEIAMILNDKEASLRVRLQRCLASLGRNYSQLSSQGVTDRW
ncbi:MAG: sigma-70 family RNA polymerase sigma factor [Desulfomonile tiedjei]|nr:sigma-70 family RNA polymerase sigma factor [Desulfomonile tiedjei]